jgi:hypothetical protein
MVHLLNIKDFLVNPRKIYRLLGTDLTKVIEHTMSSSARRVEKICLMISNLMMFCLSTLTLLLSFHLESHPDPFLKITEGITAMGE